MNSERGQSEILGFVLLIGIVGIGSVAILLTAGTVTDGIESQAEIDRIEGAFVELSTSIATASATTDTGSSTELGIDATEGTIQKTEAGNITVSIDGEKVVDDKSLGAIEYTNNDGSVVAYEGGGVWRGTGDSSMPISGPPITYQDNTLTLPIYSLANGSVSGRGVAVSDVNTTSTYSGLPGGAEESHDLRLNVTTAYHQGWAEYFKSLDNTSVTTHGTGEYRTVEVIVGISDLPEEIDDVSLNVDRDSVLSATGGAITTGDARNSHTSGGVISPGDVTINHPVYGDVISGGDVTVNSEVTGDVIASGDVTGNGDISGEIKTHTNEHIDDLPDHEPVDEAYNQILEHGEGEELGYLSGGDRVEAGQYFANGIDVNSGTLELDVSDGDIDIVIDGGNVNMKGNIRVTGTAGNTHVARILTSNTVSMSGNAEICPASIGTSCEDLSGSERQSGPFQLFGTSSSSFSFSGGGTFHGSIYAPQDEVSAEYFDPSGSLDFYGSFIIGGLDASGTVTFEGDSSTGPSSPTGNWNSHLEGLETDEETVYVHVRSHEITVESN